MQPTRRRIVRLGLTALGVVDGDIGTSPLYAFRECLKPEYGLPHEAATVFGVLSLIDNRGEGGIMALLALIMSIRRLPMFLALGLFGAALLYGDGVITPAISVLSATEGLAVATPAFAPWIIPATLVVLFLLSLPCRSMAVAGWAASSVRSRSYGLRPLAPSAQPSSFASPRCCSR